MYKLDDTSIPNVNHNTDFGVVMDNQLTFKLHINGITVRAKQHTALILRCFYTRDPTLLIKACTVYVRSLLEYCCYVWSPHLMCLINGIEGVQINFIKKLKGIGNLSYDESLKILNIDRLEIRRIKFDLVLYYKIINNLVDMDTYDFFKV